MPATTTVLTKEQFPCPPGNLYHSMADVAGPAIYVAVVPGSTVTGGQTVTLPVLGLGVSVIYADAMASSDATYTAQCILKPFLSGQGVQGGIILRWVTAATGAEVAPGVDLSGVSVRIMSIGR